MSTKPDTKQQPQSAPKVDKPKQADPKAKKPEQTKEAAPAPAEKQVKDTQPREQGDKNVPKTQDKPREPRQGDGKGKEEQYRPKVTQDKERDLYQKKSDVKPEGQDGDRKEGGEKKERDTRTQKGDRRGGDRKDGENREQVDDIDGKPRRPRTEGGEPRPKRQRKEREYDPDWRKKLVITGETELPVMPKTVLQKPSENTLKDNLAECDRKVKDYQDKIEKLKIDRQKYREKEKEKREKERLDRNEAFESKKTEGAGQQHIFQDQKALKAKLDPISKDKKELEKKISDIDGLINDLERKFLTKSTMTLDQVNDEIKELESKQMNDRLTGIEEKKVMQDLQTLKKQIPIAQEYTELDKQRKKLKDERKKVMEKWKPVMDQKRALDGEITIILDKKKAEEDANPKKDAPKGAKDAELKGAKDAPKGAKDAKDEKEVKEAKDEKKEERPKPDDPFSKQIDELIDFKSQMFKKKDKVRDDYDDLWEKYHDQQDLIRKIEYIAKQKDYMKNIEEIKMRKAKELRREMIDEYLIQNTPKEDATLIFKDELGKLKHNLSCL